MAVALAAAVFSCPPASAADYFPAVDPADAVAENNSCTLREAISHANGGNLGGADCAPGAAGNDTIHLGAGTYDLAQPIVDEDAAASGDLDITDALTITGAGAAATKIDGHQIDRVLHVIGNIAVSISDVTITGGLAPDGNPGQAGESGGGILNAGTLTLTRVTVSNNIAGDGGLGQSAGGNGLAGGSGGHGGGIRSTGPLTCISCTIADNSAGSGGPGGAGAGAGSGSSGGLGGSGGSGGGILGNQLTIRDSTITGNLAGDGGSGGSGDATAGNGYAAGNGGGVVGGGSITDSRITGNKAGKGGPGGQDLSGVGTGDGGLGGAGGGVATFMMTFTRVVISGNEAGAGGRGGFGQDPFTSITGDGGPGGYGGGVRSDGATTFTLVGSTISGNKAGAGGASSNGSAGTGGNGGGINGYKYGGSFTTGTISGNSAGKGGSGLIPGNGGSGGGIDPGSMVMNVANSTIAGNASGAGGDRPSGGSGGAGGSGGGIAVHSTMTLTDVTLAGNTTGAAGNSGAGGRAAGGGIEVLSGSASLARTIIASNTPANCIAPGGPVTDRGFNVSFPDATCPGASGNPLLAALASNGGPTQTMKLGEGSSAIDLAPSGCPATDQRGTTRPQRNACDAGAFELEGAATPATQTPTGGDGGGQTPATNTPAGQQPDKTPPVVKLLLKRQKLLRALRRGYRCRFRTNEPGKAASALRLKRKRKRVARGALVIAKPGTQAKCLVKFTRKAKRAYRKRKKLTLRLRLVVADLAGNKTAKTKRIVLRR